MLQRFSKSAGVLLVLQGEISKQWTISRKSILLVTCIFLFIGFFEIPWYLRNEKAEVEFLRRHKTFTVELGNVSPNAWLTGGAFKDSESQKDARLFLSRYSKQLRLRRKCDSCKKSISRKHMRCLECSDLILCCKCYKKGKKPAGHEVFHLMTNLR